MTCKLGIFPRVEQINRRKGAKSSTTSTRIGAIRYPCFPLHEMQVSVPVAARSLQSVYLLQYERIVNTLGFHPHRRSARGSSDLGPNAATRFPSRHDDLLLRPRLLL